MSNNQTFAGLQSQMFKYKAPVVHQSSENTLNVQKWSKITHYTESFFRAMKGGHNSNIQIWEHIPKIEFKSGDFPNISN